MDAGIGFAELLAYNEGENTRWKEFFTRHPEALDLPLDIAGTVRQLVLHIVSVELYYANEMSKSEKVDRDSLPIETLDEIFAVSELSGRMYREFFASATPADWSEQVELSRIGLKVSKRKLLAQAMTHSIRHWAQIATFLRQQGFKQEWRHDLIVSRVME